MSPLLAALLAVSTGIAPRGAGNESVTVSARVEPSRLAPAQEATLALTVTVPEGFHIYGVDLPQFPGIPASVTLHDTAWFQTVGPLREPQPEFHYDEIHGVKVPWHRGQPTFLQTIRVSGSLGTGDYQVRGVFGYQLCDETSCRLPAEAAFSASVTVVSDGPPPRIVPQLTIELPPHEPGADEPPSASKAGTTRRPVVRAKFVGYDPSEERFLAFLRTGGDVVTSAERGGLLAFVGGAILAGLLSILTPCVFPMIPITISFFTRMASGSRRESVLLAGTYSLGIIVAYTAIGLVVSLLLGAGGVQNLAASPVMNLILAAVLLFFACNLLGAFELRISAGGMGAARRQEAGKFLSVLLMALAFSLASFTCTAGFVGALLVAASQGEVSWPLIGMLAYSSAFAAPFFLLALFPGWLASLPQAGGWMNRIKVTMGFLLFAATFKFLSNADAVLGWRILSRETVLTVWVATFLILAFYLLGKVHLPHDDPAPGALSVQRMFLALLSLALALHLGLGLAGRQVWGALDGLLPPAPTPKEEEWPQDYEAALARAKREGKMVFVDFSGYTCTNCKLMEHKVFTLPSVRAELEKFVRVRLYTDGGPDKKRNQLLAQELGGTLALPLYVILDPGA